MKWVISLWYDTIAILVYLWICIHHSLDIQFMNVDDGYIYDISMLKWGYHG